MSDRDEFKFNIGISRVQFIGELINKASKSYFYALQNDYKQKYMVRWKNYLDTLFMEIKHYLDEEEQKNIQERIDNIELDGKDKSERKEQLQELRSLRVKLGQVLKNKGLDIPREKNFDPEKAFEQGRR